MEINVILGILVVILLLVAVKCWFEMRKLRKNLKAKDEENFEIAKRMGVILAEKKEWADKIEKEKKENACLLKRYDALGIKCVKGPYPISWNESDVVFLTDNAFVKKGHIYPNPEKSKKENEALVVVINKATKAHIFLEFLEDAPQ